MARGEEEPVRPGDMGDVLPWKQKQGMEVEGKGRSSSPQRDAVTVPVPWASGFFPKVPPFQKVSCSSCHVFFQRIKSQGTINSIARLSS